MNSNEIMTNVELHTNIDSKLYGSDEIAFSLNRSARVEDECRSRESLGSTGNAIYVQPGSDRTECFNVSNHSSQEDLKNVGDGKHVCSRTSINPFFNFLRLYRMTHLAKGKSATQLAKEGARIWKAMMSNEKDPFKRVALNESRRRFNNNRQKRSRNSNKRKTRAHKTVVKK